LCLTPTLSKGEGAKKSEVKVLSFGEDLGEAKLSGNPKVNDIDRYMVILILYEDFSIPSLQMS
jgi:hypothetical protein